MLGKKMSLAVFLMGNTKEMGVVRDLGTGGISHGS